MTPERWQQVKDLFQSALEREAGQRAAFLDEACASDPELRRQIDALLVSHEQAPRFLETPALVAAPELLRGDQAETMLGRRLGPYQVVREIGHGGMGAVYLATRADDEYRKQVAIKLVKRGMDTDAILRRFRNERQILANLDHAHIAKLLDGGTTEDGLSYFVMDYVEGLPIDVYCDTHRLPTIERLKLFCNACSAVHYAHQHHVVHRDLKPSNILVTTEGVPKLLDFGIAKVLDPEVSARTIEPTAGPRPMTPEYASPEQVRGQAITPASDVYSLGVLLYELLTGHRPYHVQSATPQEAERVICGQEPEKPSVVVGRSPLTRPLRATLSQRERVAILPLLSPLPVGEGQGVRGQHGQPQKLRRQLRGDLDNIVLMAMRKEPERRYASVQQFSEDISRHLEGLPVRARKDTLVYRGAKYIKRSKAGVASAALITLLLIALIGVGLYRSPQRNHVINSVAVLPLENLSHDPEQEYFADGMTEALITDLAQIRSLRVISRTSVMRYKATRTSLPEIARTLKVDAVLEGSVLRSGQRVRITAQLIQATTDRHLWAKTYERDMRDVLALQSEVASAIAEEVKVKLTPQEQTRLASSRPVDREAYEAYLKGRYYWNKRTGEALKRAIDYFQQAIDKEPSYALAYSGLADSYALLPIYGDSPPKASLARARAAAMKAVQIDGTVAEAHASLGFILPRDGFDWTGAEREFKRALELNPNYATAHDWYGSSYLSYLGRHTEAITETKRAQELDPLSLMVNRDLGLSLYTARRYDEAVEQYRKTLEIDPNFWVAHLYLAKAYVQKGMYEEALAELRQTREVSIEPRAEIAYTYAISGKRRQATRVLTELLELAKGQYVPPYHIAIIYAGLGDNNQAFAWLEKAYEERDVSLLWIKVEPRLDNLRPDPRFAELLRRLRFPP